jgi:hypothetical protein
MGSWTADGVSAVCRPRREVCRGGRRYRGAVTDYEVGEKGVSVLGGGGGSGSITGATGRPGLR